MTLSFKSCSTLVPLARLLLLYSAVIRLALHAFAVPQNVTIDDQNGDEETGLRPGYAPAGVWKQGAFPSCHRWCAASTLPNRTLASDNTWHHATSHIGDVVPPTVSVQFNGTAIYAFFIVPNTIPSVTRLVNLSFELDGQHVGDYVHTPTVEQNFLYNIPGYTNDTIPPGNHQLNIIVNGGANASIVLFDYAIYTFDKVVQTHPLTPDKPASSATTQTPTHRNVPAIVGSSLGSTAFILVCAALLFCYNRKRKRKWLNNSKGTFRISPFMGKYQAMSPARTHCSIDSTNRGGDRETGLQAQYVTFAHVDGEAGPIKNMGIAAHDDQFLVRWLRATQATSSSALGQELQRRMDDVQSAITALTSTVSGPGTQVGYAGHTQSYVMSESGVCGLSSVGSETESRRRRIVELRTELSKIRAQQEQLRTLGREHETLSESTNSNSEQTQYSGEVGFAS